MTEDVCSIMSALVAKSDREMMGRFFDSLIRLGLKFSFETNISEGKSVEGGYVFDLSKKEGQSETEQAKEPKTYVIRVEGIDLTNALTNPVVLNLVSYRSSGICDQFDWSLFKDGISKEKTIDAISSVMDQASLMWGQLPIKREMPTDIPALKGRRMFLQRTFKIRENGSIRDDAPVIAMFNSYNY